MKGLSGKWFRLLATAAGRRLGAWMHAAVLLAGVWASSCGAQTTLVADAHVNSALPGVNSGAISNLNVGGGYNALLQFDLSLLPAGTTAAQIRRAVLRVYCNRVTVPGMVSVAPITAAWSESGVTFATMPGVGAAVATLPATQAGQFVAVDVTALVQGWVSSPATNYGVALTAPTAAVQFDSKENDESSHAATLDVVLADAGATGATGPAGIAGPMGAQGLTGAAGPAGAAGPTGPIGAAATVTVGTVTTGAAGTQAAVTNAGSSGAAVLNFTIPRGATGTSGAAGTSGGGGSSGIAFASVYHGGSFGDLYYSVSSSLSSATESAPLLAWVPGGCSATELTVFSQQTTPVTVTLRAGPVANLANTALVCAVAAGGAAGASCTATGSVAVAAGEFVDLGVSGANGTGAVWTALQCN